MSSELSPYDLGRELRSGSSRFLKRRRNIIGLMFLSSAMLGGIALYQTGILKKLPGPRWRGVDAEKVNGSGEAYSILRMPDSLLGILSYAVTACLTGLGGDDRSQTHPLMPLGMAMKLLADAAIAGKLTMDSCRRYQAISPWSLLTAAASFTALPLAIPEAKAALRSLRGKDHAW
jgi:hypothetical protein